MKYWIIGLLIAVFCVSFSSAISTSLLGSYQPSESVIINISGNILSTIKIEQIEFKRANVLVPLESGIEKFGNVYYLWFIAPKEKGNYTIYIKDLETTLEGRQEKIEFKQDFSIAGNLTDYNIKPGAITTQEDFSIDVSVYKDEPIEINVELDEVKSVELQPGENKIDFSIKNIEESKTIVVKIGKYAIPVRIIKIGGSSSSGLGDTATESDFRVLPIFIFRELSPNDKGIVYPITISNLGKESISNIFISYDKDYFNVFPEELKNISSGKEIEVNLTIKNIPNESIKKTIFIDFGSKVIPITVMLNRTLSTNNTKTESSVLYYCDELGGRLCSANEICEGVVKASYDGNCCVGTCKTEESSEGGGWGTIIGILIVGIIIAGGIVLFLKYKKAKPSANILDKTIGAGKPALAGKK
jgi:hypothetical protein